MRNVYYSQNDFDLYCEEKNTPNYEIEEIIIPEEVSVLFPCCFYNCKSLKEIELPSNLKILSRGCFKNCISLTSIKIPTNIKVIESQCFYGCTLLKEITFINSSESNNIVQNNCNSLLIWLVEYGFEDERIVGFYRLEISNFQELNPFTMIRTK